MKKVARWKPKITNTRKVTKADNAKVWLTCYDNVFFTQLNLDRVDNSGVYEIIISRFSRRERLRFHIFVENSIENSHCWGSWLLDPPPCIRALLTTVFAFFSSWTFGWRKMHPKIKWVLHYFLISLKMSRKSFGHYVTQCTKGTKLSSGKRYVIWDIFYTLFFKFCWLTHWFQK